MSEFGEYMKGLRESRGLGVNQLAAYSGVSPSLISKVENGVRGAPKPTVLKKLHKHLGVTYEELLLNAGHLDSTKNTGQFSDEIEEFDHDIDIYGVDDILKKYTLKIDGKELTEEEAREFLAFVRAKRSLN